MFCPFCRYPDSRVIDSRTSDDGLAIRRRRQCPQCGRRFSTTETASLERHQAQRASSRPFSREKIVAGVRKACQGRPVTDADLALLAQRVEESIRATGVAQIEANDIGLAILPPLRELDEVAYLRFASVYQAFDSLDDFESAITLLRVEHDGADRELRPEPRKLPRTRACIASSSGSSSRASTPSSPTTSRSWSSAGCPTLGSARSSRRTTRRPPGSE